MDKYLKRCVDTRLKDKLDSSGAVCIKISNSKVKRLLFHLRRSILCFRLSI